MSEKKPVKKLEAVKEKEAVLETPPATILEQAAAPITTDLLLSDKVQAKLVKLASGAPLLEILKDHLTAITAAMTRGDERGAALMLNRGLSTLEAYTKEIAGLHAAAEQFNAATIEVQASHERIIAVLQERASATPVNYYVEAYERIAALEERVNAPSVAPEIDTVLHDRIAALEERVNAPIKVAEVDTGLHDRVTALEQKALAASIAPFTLEGGN